MFINVQLWLVLLWYFFIKEHTNWRTVPSYGLFQCLVPFPTKSYSVNFSKKDMPIKKGAYGTPQSISVFVNSNWDNGHNEDKNFLPSHVDFFNLVPFPVMFFSFNHPAYYLSCQSWPLPFSDLFFITALPVKIRTVVSLHVDFFFLVPFPATFLSLYGSSRQPEEDDPLASRNFA
jgi:hypothetical protein